MMAPGAYERLISWRQQELLLEAAAERLAAEARPNAPSLRRWLAGFLYDLAALLSAGVAEARSGPSGIRTVATSCGVEYWRPAAMPLRR
jgi:hypothetical protein